MTKTTLKKLTSLLLAFTMLCGIIVIDTSSYAADVEATEKIEEPQIDLTTADYPIMLGNRINTARLTKMWQAGGNDIDGNAIGNVEYTYQYGRMSRQSQKKPIPMTMAKLHRIS